MSSFSVRDTQYLAISPRFMKWANVWSHCFFFSYYYTILFQSQGFTCSERPKRIFLMKKMAKFSGPKLINTKTTADGKIWLHRFYEKIMQHALATRKIIFIVNAVVF